MQLPFKKTTRHSIRLSRYFVGLVWLLGLTTSLTMGQADSVDFSVKTYTEEMRQQLSEATAQAREDEHYRAERSKAFGALAADTPPELRSRYEGSYQAFHRSVGELHQIYLRHQLAPSSVGDLERLREYGQLLNTTQDRLNAWRSVIAEVHAASPVGSDNFGDLIYEMIDSDTTQDNYEGLVPMARSVLARAQNPPESILEAIGYVGYANNDYDLAEEAWRKLSALQSLPQGISTALETIPEQHQKWKIEQERRQAESERDDNPRVAILTSKGLIVVELFEEEAPQAVASFIYLVERGFYNRKFFFRVVDRFAAQTGCEQADGTGNAGYTIRGEMQNENHRNIFRGSMVLLSSMDEQTQRIAPDSGSSQFLFTMLPQPVYDGQMTVFGRIVEGQSVLGLLRRLDLSNENERKDKSKRPDLILEAKILRKRNHPYIPDIVSGRLP